MALTMMLLSSCEESEVPTPKSTAPQISIMNPLNSDEPYLSGDTIMLQIHFTDDEELHEMAVFITRSHDGAIVYQQNLHDHSDSYRWVDFVMLETNTVTEFELKAIATDHELQRSEASCLFTMQP